MRPIDADALIQNYCGACANKEFCAEESCQYYEIRRRIETAQTIEPEVRHGRWIVNDRNPDYADCTCCGLSEWIGANGSREYAETLISGFKKFCPNCGARMSATDTNVCGKGGDDND